MGKEISRRDFLELASLGTVGFLVSSCAIGSRATSTEKIPKLPTGIALPPTELTPTKPIKPTSAEILTIPIPTETKEVKQGILWTQKLLFPPEIPGGSFLADKDNPDKFFLVTPEGYPATFDLTTGEKLWQWEDRGTIYGTEPGIVYVVRYDKRICALEAQTGQAKWKVAPGVSDSVEVSFPMIIGKQTVHFPFIDKGYCSECSSLLSIDKKTGQILWWENSPNRSFFKHYIQSESTIIIIPYGYGSVQDYPRGVDPTTGREKWVLDVSPDVFMNSEDRLFGIKMLEDPNTGSTKVASRAAVGIDLDSGKEIWRACKGREDWRLYTKVIEVSPTTVYALYSTDPLWLEPRYLGAFDRQTGEELWKGPDIAHLSGSIIPDWVPGWSFIGEIEGAAIVSNENLGYTDAFNFERNVGWRNDDLRINHVAGISKNTLIAGYNNPDSPPSFLFGLDSTTGERKWRLELSQVTHEAIMFHDKVIYGNGQALTVLDPETGALLSTISLPDQPTRLVPQKDFLLAQSRGNLSAVLI